MKLLMVTDTLLTGGAELFALRLCRALVQRGVEAHFLCLSREHVNPEIAAAFNDLHIVYGPTVPLYRIVDSLDRFLLRLGIDFSLKYYYKRTRLRKQFLHAYTHIHTHLFHVDHLFAELKRSGVPFHHVSTVHGDYSAEWALQGTPERHYLNLPRKLLEVKRSVNKWVVLSREHEQFFRQTLHWSDTPFPLVYNGVAPEEKTRTTGPVTDSDNAFTVGMVARGVPEKGWRYLIAAFTQLKGACRLVLTGDGPYLEALKSECKHDPRIVFTGYHPAPGQLMKSFDVFVLPTTFPYESLPSVISEALTCGVPVIATDVGEIRRMIATGNGSEAGFLLSFAGGKIDVAELYERLKQLQTEPLLLASMKQQALDAASKFSMERCTDAYMHVYRV